MGPALVTINPILPQLDPDLSLFGELIGLLSVQPGSVQPHLNVDWFTNPIEPIRQIPKQRRKELMDLLGKFLGTPKASPMSGQPTQTWYPIEFPDSQQKPQPTGLFLVTDMDLSGAPFPLRLGVEVELNTGEITAALRLQIPLADLASGAFPLVTGSEPVLVGLSLAREDRKKFEAKDISLTGLEMTAQLSVAAMPTVDLVMTGFSTGAAPRDVSLAELAAEPGGIADGVLNVALTAALKHLKQISGGGKSLEEQAKRAAIHANLLWLLGLDFGDVSKIKAIQWTSLSSWFESILEDPRKLKAWLHGFYALMKGVDVTARVAQRDKDIPGDGSEALPFAVSVITTKAGGPLLDFTLEVDMKAGAKVTPGVRIVSPTMLPSTEMDVRMEAVARLVDVRHGFQPAFSVKAIAERRGCQPLFAYKGETDEQSISPERFEAGVRFPGGPGAAVTPFADFLQCRGSKRQSLVELWAEANPIGDPAGWLLERLQDESLWQQVLEQLLPQDSGLAWNDGGIEYKYAGGDAGATAVVLRIAMEGQTGIVVGLKANTAVDWVNAAFEGALRIPDVTKPSPALEFTGTVGGAATEKLTPRMAASFGAEGFGLALEMPIGDRPLRLALVPFGGIQDFSVNQVWTVLEQAVLNDPTTKAWLQAPFSKGAPGCTPGSVLVAWKLLTDVGGEYQFPRTSTGEVDVEALTGLLPLNLIQTALSQFLADVDELELFRIDTDDAVYLTHDKTSSVYGVRLTLPDVTFVGGASASPTRLTLKTGRWMSGETDENWMTAASGPARTAPAPGIQIDLVSAAKGHIQFKPALKLVSVGVDVAGTEKNPLFDIKGYRAQGMEVRLFLDASGESFTMGAGVKLDKAAIPLGPASGPDAGSQNPVAAGLLSGESDGSDAAAPVNPEFGLRVSYLDHFNGRIVDAGKDSPIADGKIWIPVGKSFGPLLCRRVGLGFDDGPKLLVAYDGSVALGPLGIDMLDLSVGIPLRKPQSFGDYSLTLDGLNLSFDGGPVTISGSFLESGSGAQTQYTGAAMIRTEAFSIAGLGSYASINGAPSLFVFAVLQKDFGGPAFFFVTAVAAGFGFKRKLILPSIDEVQNFPLIRVIQEPDYIGSSDEPNTALAKISDAFPPDAASYWLAVGVRFRSFGQIETVALLSATFGAEFTLSVLGLSTMTLPSNLKAGQTPICYAELALRAEFNPAVGVLSVEGRLTSNSFIFDKSCKLTGGFAFFTWFSGPHEGDFVITLGGYHPQFVRPDHYPIVPRVAIDWRISNEIRISGELYFALTPSCLMAGGRLSAVYDMGWVRAWFIAYADFLVAWKPFHYDIQMGISLGASATVSLDLGLFTISLSISFELGVDLHIYGPDFAGRARVSFYVVSFTISFGGEPMLPSPILWDEFALTFLPEPAQVCSVTFTGGLMQECTENCQNVAVVNGHEFSFNAQSQVPCTELKWQGSAPAPAPRPLLRATPEPLGIAPLYETTLDSKLDISVTRKHGVSLAAGLFVTEPMSKGFPKALWGSGKPDLSRPSSDVLPAVPVGLRVMLSEAAKAGQTKHSLPPMELVEFAYELIEKKIPWNSLKPTDTITDVVQEIETLTTTLWNNSDVSQARGAILKALAGVTPYALNTISLQMTAGQAASLYQADPRMSALGEVLREDK